MFRHRSYLGDLLEKDTRGSADHCGTLCKKHNWRTSLYWRIAVAMVGVVLLAGAPGSRAAEYQSATRSFNAGTGGPRRER